MDKLWHGWSLKFWPPEKAIFDQKGGGSDPLSQKNVFFLLKASLIVSRESRSWWVSSQTPTPDFLKLKCDSVTVTNRCSWISDGHSPFSELSLDSNQWDDRSQKVRYVDQWNVRRSAVTPIPEPESASEAGHWEGEEEYTEKIFNTKICWCTSMGPPWLTHHVDSSNLLLAFEYFSLL